MTPEEFNTEFGPEFDQSAPQPGPYGHPVQPVKTGLTKRGKVAIAVTAAVLAGGGMLFWQDQAEDAKANDLQAQQLQYKRDLVALEMQKEINKTNEANAKAQETHNEALQKQIDACVNADKGLIGKQMGVTYSSVMKDCQTRYGTSDAGADIQEAAASSDTGGGGADISPTLLLAIGVGGALVVGVAASRGRKQHAA